MENGTLAPAKGKTIFRCSHCENVFPKWAGQCDGCGEWNTLEEAIAPSKVVTKGVYQRKSGYAGVTDTTVHELSSITLSKEKRYPTGLKELDRVLGGGLVEGTVVLLGGDPGIGKSTLLLQSLSTFSQQCPVLYITGEESLEQISLRAKRLALSNAKVRLCAETQLERILTIVETEKPKVLVIDSIQTVYTDKIASTPGSVSQVRETAGQLVQWAKQTQTALFLIGHVTKEGALAGPRVLEHMVDTVLYFEGQRDNRYRLIRTMKNRFGAVNELGVFAMTEKGLREVANPSALFLSRHIQDASGSIVMASWEGTRPLLVEVQALVDSTQNPQPRRVTLGFDHQRLPMLLAVLHRHGGVMTGDQDVFVNVVGGIRVNETAVDLAILCAIISSLKNRPLPLDMIVFGEVGLAGELRPVARGEERLREAQKHGFKQAIIPFHNRPKSPIDGMDVKAVRHLHEALALL